MTDSIVVALIGIAGTLLGVSVTSLFSSWNIRRQLDHDRTMKEKQREQEMKRDVYLKVIEEYGSRIQTLSSLLNDFTKPDGTYVLPTATARGKLELIATLNTVRAFAAFDTAIGELQIALFEKAMPIKILRGEHIFLQRTIDSHALRHQQVSDELQSILQTPPKSLNMTRIGQLRTQMDAVWKEWNDALECQNEVSKQVTLLSLQAVAYLQEIVTRVNEPYRNVIIALRKELGFSIDESSYRELTDQGARAVNELLSSTVTTFTNMYNEYVNKTRNPSLERSEK